MKFRITLMCIFLSMLIASSVCAQKVYYWKDEKGVMNVTTTPPPDNIKKYEEDSFKRDSPEEIRRYQAEQKAKEQSREAETRQRQQTNRAQEEAQKQNDRQQAQQQQQRKTQSEIQDARNREADKIEAAASNLIPRKKAERMVDAARIRLGLEPLPPSQEPIVETPPPVNNSPRWGTVYDSKTRRNVDGWIQP